MKWYLAGWKNYAVFRGRARRKEYWTFQLVNGAICLVLVFSDLWGGGLGSIAGMIFYLIVFIPTLAVIVRRLHDTDHSGWWLFIGLVPFVGSILFLVFMLQDSQPGENQFGPNPKTEDMKSQET